MDSKLDHLADVIRLMKRHVVDGLVKELGRGVVGQDLKCFRALGLIMPHHAFFRRVGGVGAVPLVLFAPRDSLDRDATIGQMLQGLPRSEGPFHEFPVPELGLEIAKTRADLIVCVLEGLFEQFTGVHSSIVTSGTGTMTRMPKDWEASSQAWIESVEQGDPNRVYLLDEVMLRLAGDVRGRAVVDVGGGEGRFSRMLASRGARPVLVDPVRSLLEHSARKEPQIGKVRAVGESLPIRSESMDLVVAYLCLIDIPDFRQGIREMARVLRPGGAIVVANLQSYATTLPSPSVRWGTAQKKHLLVSSYFEELAHQVQWSGIQVTNFHRPLSSYFEAFLSSGLTLEAFEEPRPKSSSTAPEAWLEAAREIPYFYACRWRKSG